MVFHIADKEESDSLRREETVPIATVHRPPQCLTVSRRRTRRPGKRSIFDHYRAPAVDLFSFFVLLVVAAR